MHQENKNCSDFETDTHPPTSCITCNIDKSTGIQLASFWESNPEGCHMTTIR